MFHRARGWTLATTATKILVHDGVRTNIIRAVVAHSFRFLGLCHTIGTNLEERLKCHERVAVSLDRSVHHGATAANDERTKVRFYMCIALAPELTFLKVSNIQIYSDMNICMKMSRSRLSRSCQEQCHRTRDCCGVNLAKEARLKPLIHMILSRVCKETRDFLEMSASCQVLSDGGGHWTRRAVRSTEHFCEETPHRKPATY
jgi:hypothetical protein